MPRKRKPEPVMKFEITKRGLGIIRINTDTYLSFGDGDVIKMVNVRYPNDGKFYPIYLSAIPQPATKAIGKNNIKLIRELIRDRLVDGVLPRKSLLEIGEIINSERKD